jgi:hypothetical protein
LSRKVGPTVLRELLGTLSNETKNTLGMIVTPIGFSSALLNILNSSPEAIILMTLKNGNCINFTMNNNAQSIIPDLIPTVTKNGLCLFYRGKHM